MNSSSSPNQHELAKATLVRKPGGISALARLTSGSPDQTIVKLRTTADESRKELATKMHAQTSGPTRAISTTMITVPLKTTPIKVIQPTTAYVTSSGGRVAPTTIHLQPSNTPVLVTTPQRGLSNAPTALLLPSGGNNSMALKRTAAVSIDLDSNGDFPETKRRKEKGSKGLRHFSMKVCEKVQRKGVTTYNEVADELVQEFNDPSNRCSSPDDQKNIRRRVYDALNVLMAMNIISKERKEIRWIGLPTNSLQECQTLETKKKRLLEKINYKKQQLEELLLQLISFKNLVERNRQNEERQGGPPASAAVVHLPFIIVSTSKKTVIDCTIAQDKCEYLFNFDNTFEIHDDMEVLKRMGMALGLERRQCSPEALQRAIKMVPRSLEHYVRGLVNPSSAPPLRQGQVASANPTLASVLQGATRDIHNALQQQQESPQDSSEVLDV